MIMRFGNEQDIEDILILDQQVFSPEWLWTSTFIKDILGQNKFIYRVLEESGRVKAFYCVFPLDRNIYEGFLGGNIQESDLTLYLKEYHAGEEICMYMATINVDISLKSRKRTEYIRMLVNDFSVYSRFLEEKSVFVEEIGAIAVTRAGYLFSKRMGMTPCAEIRGGTVFRVARPDGRFKA